MKKIDKKQGFTLVEITVTTGIIFLIAAISIFSFSRIRININNAAALGNVQSIADAIDTYQIAYKDCPESVNKLATANPPYISDVFADSRHQGYAYFISASGRSCVVFARPEVDGVTGTKFIVYQNREAVRFDDFSSAAAYAQTGDQGGFGELDSPCTPGEPGDPCA